ncbi:MAG: LamG-like jellyroll fold domain-containing protein [Capsulimonas sp.]|uniref:LamG domain-containing protein n=1 Tax=Capsulimonas sp. TaxID=2494211 RepID=UPI0032652D1D
MSARVTFAGAELAATEPSASRVTAIGVEYAIALPDDTQLPFDIEPRFFSAATGKRLAVNPDAILDLTYEMLEAGGLGQVNITLARPYDADLGVIGGDIVEIWARNSDATETLRGRAQISIPEPSLDLKERWQLTCYGLMSDMNWVLLQKLIVHPGGADLKDFAAEIADDYAARRPGLTFVRDIRSTGVFLETLTLDNSTARAAMDKLQDQASRNAVWGWDIDPATHLDRFYLRPRVTTVGAQWFVGDRVRVISSPADHSNIYNAMLLQGGKSKTPQLLTNPSFEILTVPTAATGSLLANGSFEDAGGWNYDGGASREKYNAETHHNASAHSGEYYAILDSGTEEIWQEAAVTPGVQYNASLFCSRESGEYANTGSLILEGRDAGGTVIETTTLPIAPPSTAWSGGQGSTVLAGDAVSVSVTFQDPTITKVRVRVTSDNGSGQHGLLIDDVIFAAAGQLGQLGWSTHVQNPGSPANQFVWIDWACRAAAKDGVYGLRMSLIAGMDDRPALAPFPGDNSGGQGYHARVTGQQGLRGEAWVRMAPGLNTADGQIRLEYKEWAGDGHQTQATHADFDVTNDGEWTKFAIEMTTHGDGSTATLQPTFGASGVYDIDCVSLRDSAAGEEFLRGEAFELYVTAEGVCDPDTPAYDSFETYGRRESVVSNEDIVVWNDDARAWAKAQLERSAVPVLRSRVELTHEHFLEPAPGDGKQVRISGLSGPDIQEWPARVEYRWGRGALSISLELSAEAPTLAKLLKAREASSGSGSGSGSVSSSGSGGGVSTPVPATWGASPRTITDATLHDDYAPADGPHVLAAERTAWDGVVDEVAAARGASPTLNDRLVAMETGGVSEFDALTDVDITGRSDGQIPYYDAVDDLLKFRDEAAVGAAIAEVTILPVPSSATRARLYQREYAASSYDPTILAESLLSNYWPLDESSGSTAVDAAGSVNGVIAGGVTINQTGLLPDASPCYLFNGASGYVDVTGITPLSGTVTIEMWFVWSGGRSTFWDLGALDGFAGYVETNGHIHFENWNVADWDTGYVATAGNLYHMVYVAVPNGGTAKVYMNGSLVASAMASAYYGQPATNRAWIGRGGQGNATTYFNGKIEKVAWYNGELPSANIHSHYLLGAAGATADELYLGINDALGQPALTQVLTKLNRLGDLADVDTTGLADGMTMYYDAASGLFKFH